MCCTSPLASGALLQLHFLVVYDSVVRCWPPPTPLLSIAPLRDCWFAVGVLAPREGSLQQRGLLSVRIGLSFARYFSSTCSAEMSVSLVIVACFAVSFALRSAALARLVLTLLSCIARGRPHALEFCCIQSFFPSLLQLLFSLTLTWLRASWSTGTTRLRHVRIDRPVFMSGGAFMLAISSGTVSSGAARDCSS